MQVVVTIKEGTDLQTIRAWHTWMGVIVSSPDLEEQIPRWEGGFVEVVEAMKVTLFPAEPRDPEGGDLTMIIGRSYSGISSGFSEEFILGEMPDGSPTLISSEEWG